jgi:hypothetical protein
MAKNYYLYILRDEYHSPVSIANSKTTAQKQLKVLAKSTEWNRGMKIKDERDTIIYFENYDYVDFVEVPYCGTKKDFMRHFGFVEDYSKIKSALEL